MAEKLIKRGEIYWINLPLSNGREIQDRHLGLVISNDKQNMASPLITILPITSLKEGDRVYPFQVESCLQNKKGVILVEQIRTVDRKRFDNLASKVDEIMMQKIEKALHLTLALKN